MGKNLLRAVPHNDLFMDMYTTECCKCLCRYQLYPYGNKIANGKLAENIINCYMDYYIDIMKDTNKKKKDMIKTSNFLEEVDIGNRTFAIREKNSITPLGLFKLSIVEDFIKDARFISNILVAFERYYRDLRLNSYRNGYYYG